MPKTYPPELEQFVRRELANGNYESEVELLIDALTVFRELKQRHEELRQDVQIAIAEADRGDVAPLDIAAIKSELISEIDENGRPL